MKNLSEKGHSSTNISAMNNNIKSTYRRLQDIEKQLKIKPIPSFEEFKSEWNKMDALSQAVFITEAESGVFESYDNSWYNYMNAIRSYLYQMGFIDSDAETLKELARRMTEN